GGGQQGLGGPRASFAGKREEIGCRVAQEVTGETDDDEGDGPVHDAPASAFHDGLLAAQDRVSLPELRLVYRGAVSRRVEIQPAALAEEGDRVPPHDLLDVPLGDAALA